MTKKYDDFRIALTDLCKLHGVVIMASEYGTLQVWDEDSEDPDDYFDPYYWHDRTLP
jgi:hypothetical protein